MNAWFIVLGIVAAYLITGATYARSQAVKAYERARAADWYSEKSRRESVSYQLAWRTVFWPYAIVFDLVRTGVRAWFFQDIDGRQERAEQLREDAKAWEQKRYTGTPAERAMAEELARMCKQRAEEVDL